MLEDSYTRKQWLVVAFSCNISIVPSVWPDSDVCVLLWRYWYYTVHSLSCAAITFIFGKSSLISYICNHCPEKNPELLCALLDVGELDIMACDSTSLIGLNILLRWEYIILAFRLGVHMSNHSFMWLVNRCSFIANPTTAFVRIRGTVTADFFQL